MKKTKVFSLISIFIASTLFFNSCNKNNSKLDSKNSISVVATTFPCYDAVRAVAGDLLGTSVSLKLLVKPGMEIHSYDPSPADIIAVQKSDLFVYVGGESDEWVEKVLKSSDKELNCEPLTLMHFVKTVDEVEFDDAEDEHDHDENEHEQDEHIWTSPENELIIIRAVCTYLSKIAEKKGLSTLPETFESNAAAYCEQIETLIEKTSQIIASKQEKLLIMADRFPFIYFTNYYGLEFDAAFSGCSTAVEASTQTISRLIDTVKAKQLPAVFYIELGNHKIADSIAESTKTKALLLESCQNVSKTNFENGETWVTLMNKNADTLNIGLK